MKKTMIAAALSALAVSAGAASAQQLTLAAGPSGGTWYPLGIALANIIEREVPGTDVSVVNGVTVANILGTNAGQYDLAMSLSTTNAEALKGEGKHFQGPQDKITGVAAFYSSPYQMAVRKDSDVQTIADFRGKVVNPGVVGGSTDVMTQRVLDLYGLSYDDLGRVERLSYADATMQLKDGHLDVFTGIISVPSGAIAEAALGSGVRLIALTPQNVAALRQQNPGYVSYTIPAGTYAGQDAEALAVGMNNVLIANADLSAELVEKITAAIAENAAELHTVNAALQQFGLDSAAQGIGAPLHPGAAAFYDGAGVMTATQ